MDLLFVGPHLLRAARVSLAIMANAVNGAQLWADTMLAVGEL